MKLRSRRIERQPKLMIIPMIDIIFFLLVFFMMSTLYMVEQATFPVTLPQAAAQPDQRPYVSVTVTAKGTVYIGQEEIAPDAVGRRVQLEMLAKPDAGVVLRADAEAHYGVVVAVMDQLKRTGIGRIVIAAETSGTGG